VERGNCPIATLQLSLFSIIPRLHDQANIEQSSSKHTANAFEIHVHDVCSNCSMFAWWLLDRVNGVSRSYFMVHIHKASVQC